MEFLAFLHTAKGEAFRERVPVSSAIFDAFGLWPTGTEDHIAEFYNYFLTPATSGGADLGMRIRHTSQAEWHTRLAQRAGWADGSLPIEHLLKPSGESAVQIMATLLGLKEPGTYMVNIPNEGLIDNLPWDAIVEVPAYVSPAGVQGLKVGALPAAIAHTIQTRAVQQEVLVEAATTGNRQLALQALLLDAQIVDLRVAQEILARSLEANKEWLPVFLA